MIDGIFLDGFLKIYRGLVEVSSDKLKDSKRGQDLSVRWFQGSRLIKCIFYFIEIKVSFFCKDGERTEIRVITKPIGEMFQSCRLFQLICAWDTQEQKTLQIIRVSLVSIL